MPNRETLTRRLQRQWLQTAMEAEIRAWLAGVWAAILAEYRP